MLQAVFRRAGARGLIYDFLLLSCGIRLLMFQPCFDRILICLIRSLIYYNSDVRSALSARTSAFKSGNTDDRKQASYDFRKSIKAAKRQYINKVEEQFNTNNTRSMWQGINNITGFKGNKPATVYISASLPDELNTFYARFEADNTAHTESAPVAAAEEVSALSLSVADVTQSFKRVNICKAVFPDGIPDRVLRACAFQLAGVFRDIFNLSLSLSVVPSCFKKIHHCAHTEERYNHMLV